MVLVRKPNQTISGEISLSGSKSISNRALIIKALCKDDFVLENLSSSQDTVTLIKLLTQEDSLYDAGDAGTSFRFMTAFLALRDGAQTLTGSERMLERPIGPLVVALRSIGCPIEYLEKENYPPIRIGTLQQKSNTVEIDSSISSQFISALCLIAPVLPMGLEIKLAGPSVSSSYLKMTLGLMHDFGVSTKWAEDTIKIDNQNYSGIDYRVEGDWSSASYLYAICALSPGSQISINNLFEKSLQGDAELSNIMSAFGVKSEFLKNKVIIRQEGLLLQKFEFDFINNPDLAQTLAVLCAAMNIEAHFKGLKTLTIKETDRLSALKNELNKINIDVAINEEKDAIHLKGHLESDGVPEFMTYGDHRMAMSLSILALLMDLKICEPLVVNKSYPQFWDDLRILGFTISE